MVIRSMFWVALGFTLLESTAGCSGDAGAGRTLPELTGTGWEELITGDWELAPGTEAYRCVRVTLPEDVIVGAFKPLGPPGTHHTTLSLGTPSHPDGTTECGGLDGFTAGRGIWGSGVNTDAAELPAGVGMRLEAGQQLMLNLHLFNTTTAPLSGHSGIAIRRMSSSAMTHEAGATLIGPVDFMLPPGEMTTVSGGCTFKQPETIVGVLPHMHRTGRHMKIVAERANQLELTIFDGAFDFMEQLTYPVPSVAFGTGDRLRVECTFENDTDRAMGFGESTNDEMCIAGTALYPRMEEPGCIQ